MHLVILAMTIGFLIGHLTTKHWATVSRWFGVNKTNLEWVPSCKICQRPLYYVTENTMTNTFSLMCRAGHPQKIKIS